MAKKKRGTVLEQIEEGRRIAWGAYKKNIKGFTVGMRVSHQMYGKGEIVIAEDNDHSLQRYWMKLDNPVSLGGGERLNSAWVWPGHLTKEEIKEDKKSKIKSKLKKEKATDEKPKRKRKTRKKK
jgi:hypothetical protein